jgi:hypothetical protein
MMLIAKSTDYYGKRPKIHVKDRQFGRLAVAARAESNFQKRIFGRGSV